jgi:hypothetical protein
MVFTLETAISELRIAVPECPIDNEWEQDNLAYLAFSELARFICSEAEVLQYVTSEEEANRLSKFPICMQFLEHAFEQGDSNAREMILDCVDNISGCQWGPQIKKWAGPHVSAIWPTIS